MISMVVLSSEYIQTTSLAGKQFCIPVLFGLNENNQSYGMGGNLLRVGAHVALLLLVAIMRFRPLSSLADWMPLDFGHAFAVWKNSGTPATQFSALSKNLGRLFALVIDSDEKTYPNRG